MNKLFFGVVIYNKNFNESVTCTRLNEIAKDEKILIADNSTKKNDFEEQCLQNKWIYISMEGNKGISVAYNAIINKIKENKEYSENDILVLLDDDTEITKEYIEKLKESINTYAETNIFMPIIRAEENVIISPSKYTKIRNIKLNNKEQINKLKTKEFLGINTCLAIRMKIFKNYIYTTELFLDLVDNQFFYDMRKRNEKFYCIDVEIKQNFFSTENKDYNKEIIRKKIQKKDYKNFVKNKSLTEKIMYYIRILFWKIKGSVKYKTFKYFVDLK